MMMAYNSDDRCALSLRLGAGRRSPSSLALVAGFLAALALVQNRIDK